MPDNTNIDNMVKELQLAREKSILGEYESSFELFKFIMTKIQF